MPLLRKVMLNTTLGWFASSDFSKGRTHNATHTVLPASLNIQPKMNNTEMTAWLSTNLPGLRNYTSTQIGDLPPMVDEQGRYVVLHRTGQGDSDIGPYFDEYMWVFKTTHDGKLIEQSWEYIDSDLFRKYSNTY